MSKLIQQELKDLLQIFGESPFFVELLIKERLSIIKKVIEDYPDICPHLNEDYDVGYEAGWRGQDTR